MKGQITAADVISRIETELPQPHEGARYEGLVAGVSSIPVQGILVVNIPTVGALRHAAAIQRNFILSRTHPYFYQGGITDRGNENELKEDAVVAAKHQLIESGKLVVYRMAAAWDTAKPRSIASAVANSLGYEAVPAGRAPRFVYCAIGKTTLSEVATRAMSRLGGPDMRVTGDGNTPVSRVAIGPGMGFGSQIMAEVFSEPVDAVVTDVVLDVDGGSTYIEDMITSGRRIGMIQAGCERFEHPANADVTQWAKTLFPELKVDALAESEPWWLP